MTKVQNFIIFVVFFTFQNWSYAEYVPETTACDSQIYCTGAFLHKVQMLKIFDDSKTFVDMKVKVNCTLDEITNYLTTEEWTSNPNNVTMKGFVDRCFEKEGSELEQWTPTDFKSNLTFIESIKDTTLRKWAYEINLLWIELGRTIKDDVRVNPTKYSLIYVPNPIIIPGGRFREIYYWDSYWIIRGLLLCEMNITARGMIANYISMIKTYGHVPNGGRIYYSKRSQPPMTIPMIKSYVDATNDMEFVRENINHLEEELKYWITQHNVTISKHGQNYTLAVYRDTSTGPRPESYREDVKKATKHFTTVSEQENFYSEIKAAAESGWDFSSRWFILNGTNEGDITNTKTRSIVPVDLNSLVYWNAKILSDFYQILNNTIKALEYADISMRWKEAVAEVLWDEEVGCWLDYDLMNNKKRNYFYPTNISPLWTGCYDKNKTDYLVTRAVNYLNKSEILNTPGGIPTTLRQSGQQWDQPNAWAPLQYIVVMALKTTDNEDAKIMASKIADKWLCTNYVPHYNYSKMYEKYRVDVGGQKGESLGEYEIQDGFGWTNGIVLEFLQMYNSTASSENWNVTAKACDKVLKKLKEEKELKIAKELENYRVDEGGQKGKSSGEYEIQDGFGWTNGIVLEFLQMYNSTASSENWNVTAPACDKVLKKLKEEKELKIAKELENVKNNNNTDKIDKN